MRIKKIILILFSIVLLVIFTGCSNSSDTGAQKTELTTPKNEKVELYIAAAASLTDVLTEITEEYKIVAPDVTLTFSFDSSGTLQTQIEEGAPADIFISAAQKQMNSLEEKGFIISKSRKNLLLNKVVLIVPASQNTKITSFEDAATDVVSMIAVGEASVPVGQYTEEIYKHLGLWDKITTKANYGSNVRAVLSWVESGDVDCGIVYATDAASTEAVKIICEAPDGSHKPVIYPAAIITNSQYVNEAQDFLDFLNTDTAIAAFEAAGFTMSH